MHCVKISVPKSHRAQIKYNCTRSEDTTIFNSPQPQDPLNNASCSSVLKPHPTSSSLHPNPHYIR